MPKVTEGGKYDSLVKFLNSTLHQDDLCIVNPPLLSWDIMFGYRYIVHNFPNSIRNKIRRIILGANHVIARVGESSMISGFAIIKVYDPEYLECLIDLANAYEQHNPTKEVRIVSESDHRRKKKKHALE